MCSLALSSVAQAQSPFGTGSAMRPDTDVKVKDQRRSNAASSSALTDTSVGSWVYGDYHDDFANKTDQRLTLRAENASHTSAGDSVYAALVISCGNQFRSNGHRSMLLMTGIPLAFTAQPISDYARLDYRFDTDTKPRWANEDFLDVEHRTLYLGDFWGFFFSKSFFAELLNAKTVTFRYTPMLGDYVETVTFHVAALRAALLRMGKCDWPMSDH